MSLVRVLVQFIHSLNKKRETRYTFGLGLRREGHSSGHHTQIDVSSTYGIPFIISRTETSLALTV